MGLLVGDHLQAVLEPAQEPVGGDQIVGDLRLDPAGRRQRAQRRAGRRRPHLRQPAAQDQLLRLDEELDLADAAAADLEIVAGDPDPAVAAMRVDLPLDRMDVADRGEVEMAAPQERPQPAEQALADRLLARDHARLDQRRALPVLAVALVVLRGVLDRQRQRLAGRMRPQPQVDPEHVALLGALLEQVDQRAGQPHGERHRTVAAAAAQPFGREQDDQVEVAGVVQLERAELAHAEHGDAGRGLRIGLAVKLEIAALGGLQQCLVERLADRQIGEARRARRSSARATTDRRCRRAPPRARPGACAAASAAMKRWRGPSGVSPVCSIRPSITRSGPSARTARTTSGSASADSAEIGAVAEDRRERAHRGRSPAAPRAAPATSEAWPSRAQRARPRSAAAGSPTRGNAAVSNRERCVTFRVYLNCGKLAKAP